MFDLEKALAQWRRTLAGRAAVREEVLDELESHLRDQFQQLTGAGQSPEAAFAQALSRLGDSQTLAAEFAKIALGPVSWLPVQALGTLFVLLAGLVSLALALRAGQMGLLLAGHVYTIILGYGLLYFVGALAFCYVAERLFRDLSRGQRQMLTRVILGTTCGSAALTAIGILLGACWARDNLGRFWAWDPREIGGLLVLAWNGVMLLSFWRRWVNEHILVLMGLAGNVVVSLSWFGASFLAARSHTYFTAQIPVYLALFVFSQLVVLCAGLAPSGWLRRKKA